MSQLTFKLAEKESFMLQTGGERIILQVIALSDKHVTLEIFASSKSFVKKISTGQMDYYRHEWLKWR